MNALEYIKQVNKAQRREDERNADEYIINRMRQANTDLPLLKVADYIAEMADNIKCGYRQPCFSTIIVSLIRSLIERRGKEAIGDCLHCLFDELANGETKEFLDWARKAGYKVPELVYRGIKSLE